ncbi:MAG: hypothetical protein LBH13_01870 [Cellulomonadaceae bacterium]|jgi:hypothetical protein|nr:hypothetical protein [Cellulomonadaceae bacterium]
MTHTIAMTEARPAMTEAEAPSHTMSSHAMPSHAMPAPTEPSRAVRRRKLTGVLAMASVLTLAGIVSAPAASAVEVTADMDKPYISETNKVGDTFWAGVSPAYWSYTYVDGGGEQQTESAMSTQPTCQWLRNNSTVVGTNCSTYKVQKADYGHKISLRVTAKAPSTSPVPGVTLKPVVATSVERKITLKGQIQARTVIITGVGAVGKTVKAKPIGFTTSPSRDAVTLKYQWIRDGLPIRGATKKTYTLTKADFKADVHVRVTASAPGYQKLDFWSGNISAPQVTMGTVKVQGAKDGGYADDWTVKAGTRLTAKTSGFKGAKSYTYSWMVWDSKTDSYKVLSKSKSYTPTAAVRDNPRYSSYLYLRVDARPKAGSGIKNSISLSSIHLTK